MVVLPGLALIALVAYLFRREFGRVARYFEAWRREDDMEDQCAEAARREVMAQEAEAEEAPQQTHG